MATPRRLEAIQRQIEIARKHVERAVKLRPLIVHVLHHAAMNAVNFVKVNHRGLVDFNARQCSPLNHRANSKSHWIKKTNATIGADYRDDLDLKVRDHNFLKLYEVQIFPNVCARGPPRELVHVSRPANQSSRDDEWAGSSQREIKRLMD
ncbi:hypothetical protein [Bradyrhizobium japonicum]|uniref:hypothetical protein n=1 Tax=Bradyrhizobium japonicum TaxID=375 RepID=UPI001269B599|nr:hypothetical protein [Bradyrhizobium japonicum]